MCFFFNDTATTEIYTLSLHDALPIWGGAGDPALPARHRRQCHGLALRAGGARGGRGAGDRLERAGLPDVRSLPGRSEEHTSELQSRQYLVCRLLLEKKKKL